MRLEGSNGEHTNIVVDDFTVRQKGQQLHFFLTHAHTDHIKGIDSFYGTRLYCSETTATLVSAMIPRLKNVVYPLEMNEPKSLQLANGTAFTVTPIDANHCPGSVMFLFDGEFGKILHTGDFRWDDAMQTALPLAEVAMVGINRLYTDATFAHPKVRFPPKHLSISRLLDALREREQYERVYLAFSGLGSEEMLVGVSQEFKSKIYIDQNLMPKRYLELTTLASLRPYLSTEYPEKHKFHLCPSLGFRKFMKERDSPTTLFIKASAMWHARTLMESHRIGLQNISEVAMDAWGALHILFSMHSDYHEIEKLVRLVRPVSIHPICKSFHLADDLGLSLSQRELTTNFAPLLRGPSTAAVNAPGFHMSSRWKPPVPGKNLARLERTMAWGQQPSSASSSSIDSVEGVGAPTSSSKCGVMRKKWISGMTSVVEEVRPSLKARSRSVPLSTKQMSARGRRILERLESVPLSLGSSSGEHNLQRREETVKAEEETCPNVSGCLSSTRVSPHSSVKRPHISRVDDNEGCEQGARVEVEDDVARGCPSGPPTSPLIRRSVSAPAASPSPHRRRLKRVCRIPMQVVPSTLHATSLFPEEHEMGAASTTEAADTKLVRNPLDQECDNDMYASTPPSSPMRLLFSPPRPQREFTEGYARDLHLGLLRGQYIFVYYCCCCRL